MIEPPPLQLEDIWKKETIKQHSALLERDCAQFFHSHGDPVAAGVAAWVPCVFCGREDFKTLFSQHSVSLGALSRLWTLTKASSAYPGGHVPLLCRRGGGAIFRREGFAG